MSADTSAEISSGANRGRPDAGLLGLARTVAVVAVVAGAVGSLGFMLRAGRNTPRVLLVLFVLWVLSPFVALGWAITVSKRWAALTRAALYGVTVAITLVSLAIYKGVISPPAGSPRAFLFVVVPPASWMVATMIVSVAALISRTRSRRGSGG
jgi:hypothetical protein